MSGGYPDVALGGDVLDAGAMATVASVMVREVLSAPALAEVAFADPTDAFVTRLDPGVALTVATALDAPLFDGEITAIEHRHDGTGGRTVLVRGYDRLHRLRKSQRARAVRDQSAATFIAETLDAHGLTCTGGAGSPRRALIVQHDRSDFEMIAALAAEEGLLFRLDGTTLRLFDLAGDGDAGSFDAGRTLARVSARVSAETLRSGTTTRAWNVARTAVLDGAAAAPRRADDRSPGSGVAFAGLGARALYNRGAEDAAAANALAQADLDRAAQHDVVIEAVAAGTPAIRPGRTLAVTGLGGRLDRRYTVTSVEHDVTAADGYRTAFSTEPPARPEAAGSTPAFTVATVTDVEDPERWSRVAARLPLLGDVETGWLPVVVPGAGAGKGMVAMPEVGDDVLVVFPHGDPAQGLVLGGLYGERQSPGLGGGGTRPYAMRTGNGQSFVLDAAQGLARIETSVGDVIELGPEGTRIHATGDLMIEAPGRTLTIRARAINFEQG